MLPLHLEHLLTRDIESHSFLKSFHQCNFSPEQIVDAIVQYYENKDLYEKHKKNTISSIENFDLSIITQKTIQGYKEIVD